MCEKLLFKQIYSHYVAIHIYIAMWLLICTYVYIYIYIATYYVCCILHLSLQVLTRFFNSILQLCGSYIYLYIF